MKETVKESVRKCVNESAKESANESVKESVNESVRESAKEMSESGKQPLRGNVREVPQSRAKRQKLRVCLIAALAVALLLPCMLLMAEAVTYKRGSTGSVVTQIQNKLKSWGYYTGEADGVYGRGTEQAVRQFQQKNGLNADGMAGPATLEALGVNGGGAADANSGDVALLARLISAESRGEPYSGQVAVGAVVLNRMKHPSFPNTMSGVIYQKGAFSCLDDGQFNEPVADSCYRAAQDALNGWDPSGGAIYYFNPETATSQWIWSRPTIVVIGKHRFCS